MQTAQKINPKTEALSQMKEALNQMPVATSPRRSLPISMHEITRYVDQLLTPKEQRVCDMATD